MPLGRTFSFENDGESNFNQPTSTPSHGQPNYTFTSPSNFSPYHEESPLRNPPQHQYTPSRDIISPPPAYNPPSPESPTRAGRYRRNSAYRESRQSYQSIDNSPRPLLNHSPDRETFATPPPPPPPPHRRLPSGQPANDGRLWGQEIGYGQAIRPDSLVSPEADSFSERAEGGGIHNIAQGVADRNQRESGVRALRAMEATSDPQHRNNAGRSSANSAVSSYYHPDSAESQQLRSENSGYAVGNPFATPALTPSSITPGANSLENINTSYSGHSIPLNDYPSNPPMATYHDSPYMHSSLNNIPQVGTSNINPTDIADDGDDGFIPDPKRRSMLALGRSPSRDLLPAAAGAGAAAGGGGLKGAIGSIVGRKQKNQTSSGTYNAVGQENAANGTGDENGGSTGGEKSEWLSRQTKGNNRMRWVVGLAIGTVVLLAIIGGVVGGILGSKKSSSSSAGKHGSSADSSTPAWNSTNSAQTDTEVNGDLNKDSGEIKALLNNDDLHKVFPGVDYTPWGTQYPLCEKYPPSQNNVTRDMAVLSQLTNAVRLYGTDCNQTEMVLHAIDRLELKDMKLWLGVWVDTNDTTTKRQMDKMYKILENTKDQSIFKGVIVGNEALYRAGVDKATSQQQLIDQLKDVKSQFSSKGYKLPVATSDLGDNWNGELVNVADIVMSNIHPFFAGVKAEDAASWTYDFWDGHDLALTKGTNKKQVISETGWPSGGGNDCGSDTAPCPNPTAGSVAGIQQLNTFLDDWVCPALKNGTDYFFFEFADEPWKVAYNTPGKEWEDKWGLVDPARKLKPGIKIPSCGGQTVPA
ncbi:MAG: hypothetical protein Q9160_005362 [Pyrenula sp. 1 TL-2023]